jgi:hypothetical protein
MKRKRCGVLILTTALLIIGMRGVCAAHYSEHLSIDKSDTQKCNGIQVVISIDKSMQTRFVFRVKRYFYVPPKQSHTSTELDRDLPGNPDKSAFAQKSKRYHGLVPWSFMFAAKQNQNRSFQMPRACPVEPHVYCYFARNVKLHGASPWHLRAIGWTRTNMLAAREITAFVPRVISTVDAPNVDASRRRATLGYSQYRER